MFKALVIGCGKIGALYDFDNDQIQSHVKAFSLDRRFSVSIYDIDNEVTKKVSAKYNCEILNVIDKRSMKKFDCVSVCVPTEMHFSTLNMAIDAGIGVIVCEKPVSNKMEELDNAKLLYSGSTRILVNYIRRFQPCFLELKELITSISAKENLTNIEILYQRGFLNNCSHAFDIIEFLTGSEINLTDIKKHNVIHDHFVYDPTMSLQAKWNRTNISIIGLSQIFYSHFEIALFFEYHKICIRNAGNTIEIHKAEKSKDFLLPLNKRIEFKRSNCLNNYMVNVIDRVYELLINRNQTDNFLQSVNLNQKMLNYLTR